MLPDTKREDSYREMMVKLGTAVILAESAAYRVPIKQENRTPEEQAAVEDFSSSWVSIRAILREYEAFGRADALARVSAHRAGEGELTPCPCGEPVPEGYPPCTFEKPCPYAEGMPESRWAQSAEEGEGLVVQWAVPSDVKVGEKVLDTSLNEFRRVAGLRPYGEHGGYEIAYEGDEREWRLVDQDMLLIVVSAQRAGERETQPCCWYHHFNTRIPEWNTLSQKERTEIVAARCDLRAESTPEAAEAVERVAEDDRTWDLSLVDTCKRCGNRIQVVGTLTGEFPVTVAALNEGRARATLDAARQPD